MADIQHANIPEAQLHETKGASTASANTWLGANGDGTATFQSLPTSEVVIEDSLLASSTVDQLIGSNGTEVQLILGSAATSPNGLISVAGTGAITVNADGVYMFDLQGAMTRSQTNTYSTMLFGTRLNGTQEGDATSIGIETANVETIVPVTHTQKLSLSSGDVITFHMLRQAGAILGDVGLTSTTVTDTGWSDAPSVSVNITKLNVE